MGNTDEDLSISFDHVPQSALEPLLHSWTAPLSPCTEVIPIWDCDAKLPDSLLDAIRLFATRPDLVSLFQCFTFGCAETQARISVAVELYESAEFWIRITPQGQRLGAPPVAAYLASVAALQAEDVPHGVVVRVGLAASTRSEIGGCLSELPYRDSGDVIAAIRLAGQWD